MTLITSLSKPRPIMAALIICGAVLTLSGCSDFRKAIGDEKSSPDEFEVVVRPPLSLPPSFTASSAELLAAADEAYAEASNDARSVTAASMGSEVGSSEGGYEALFDSPPSPTTSARRLTRKLTASIRAPPDPDTVWRASRYRAGA